MSTVEGLGKGLLSAKETARRLGISLPTLSRLTTSGKIGSYKIGVRRLYSERHITDFLNSVESKTAAA